MRNGCSEAIPPLGEFPITKIVIEGPPYTLVIPTVQSITEMKREISRVDFRENFNNNLIALQKGFQRIIGCTGAFEGKVNKIEIRSMEGQLVGFVSLRLASKLIVPNYRSDIGRLKDHYPSI